MNHLFEELDIILTKDELSALKEFRERLLSELGQSVSVIKLYGSKARGDFTQNSDLDTLVITTYHKRGLARKITDLACEIGLKYDVYISAKSMSQDEYARLRELDTFFVRSIEQEGKTLWKAA